MNHEEADRIVAAVMERLKQEREGQGLSLQQLGVMSGVSRTAIGMIEKGQRNPSLGICLRLADTLGVSLGDVLKAAEKG